MMSDRSGGVAEFEIEFRRVPSGQNVFDDLDVIVPIEHAKHDHRDFAR